MTSPDLQVDELLRALADSTRRALFRAIAVQPGLTTSQLASRTSGMTRWGVMKHLAVLRGAGLIQTLPQGRQRRHFAEPAALAPLRQWLAAASSTGG